MKIAPRTKDLKFTTLDFKENSESFEIQLLRLGFKASSDKNFQKLQRFDIYKEFINKMISDGIITKGESIKICDRLLKIANEMVIEVN